ncbi:hypothetical protein CALVIDRAFT_512555 [Calocera viscosa TUFC12733]|uniref:Uncharacterized protein n=1 Tax=Calocera viscosa (strain TUFC12733) TaxID=1330018 RepID=A0A167NRZ6_CALVF|nr:hypothetical protein CALVIDRAFT_512555 [Calocera viscosa TUFC12733]
MNGMGTVSATATVIVIGTVIVTETVGHPAATPGRTAVLLAGMVPPHLRHP